MGKRKEFEKLRNKGILAKECGTVCVCCGAMDGIDYHHILPLVLGGDNRLSNIVPICASCHGKIHGTKMMCLTRYTNKAGRPKDKAPEGYKELSIKYVRNEITGNELKRVCKLDKGTRISEKWWFKEVVEGEGIVAYKKVTGGKKNKTGIVSRIWYEDGGYREIYRENGGYTDVYIPNKYSKEEVKRIGETSGKYRPDIKIVEDFFERFHE